MNVDRRALDAAGLQGSMSAVGNPYHNAHAESFIKTLKVEDIYTAGYGTFADVAERLPTFIEEVYHALAGIPRPATAHFSLRHLS